MTTPIKTTYIIITHKRKNIGKYEISIVSRLSQAHRDVSFFMLSTIKQHRI